MRKSDTLIRTKLQPPFILQNLVPRPRLEAQVIAGRAGLLTLVIAPAGFGKTTLVRKNLSNQPWRLASLSLERVDNRAGLFVKYRVAALHQADPAIGNDAVQLLLNSIRSVMERIIKWSSTK